MCSSDLDAFVSLTQAMLARLHRPNKFVSTICDKIDDLALTLDREEVTAKLYEGKFHEHNGEHCHGLSPGPPCPSEPSLPPLMAQPISDAFGSTSDPTGLSVCFSFSLTDSRMFLLSFFT